MFGAFEEAFPAGRMALTLLLQLLALQGEGEAARCVLARFSRGELARLGTAFRLVADDIKSRSPSFCKNRDDWTSKTPRRRTHRGREGGGMRRTYRTKPHTDPLTWTYPYSGAARTPGSHRRLRWRRCQCRGGRGQTLGRACPPGRSRPQSAAERVNFIAISGKFACLPSSAHSGVKAS